MSITIHHLDTYPMGANTIALRPGLSNLKAKYNSLKEMCSELGITPDQITKIGERGQYPGVSSLASHRTKEYCCAVQIRDAFFLLTFEGGDKHLAEHAMRFPGNSKPFTDHNLKNPQPPTPKPVSDMSLKEYLMGKWGGKQQPPTIWA